MKMSCSGCRVLRKGCADDCSIRPCLQWIKSPQSQAYATVFLAKFYGRAGLINLIDAGPEHLRPAIFRSLLYEACGRMVNPVHGATGLLWSGSWHLCQAAVDAVLKGAPISQAPLGPAAAVGPVPPLHKYKASSCDIRHVAKGDVGAAAATRDLDRIRKGNLKRPRREEDQLCDRGTAGEKRQRSAVEADHSPSRNLPSSPGRSPTGGGAGLRDGDRESVTTLSVETAEEASMVTSRVDADGRNTEPRRADGDELELELTLGFESFQRGRQQSLHRQQECGSSSSSRRRRHTADDRGHSPTCSSSVSAETEEYERNRGIREFRVGGNMLGIDLRLDLAA